MNKVSQITKQLTFIHKELRRTKQFFKASSISFSSFHSHMKSALDDLNHCDIFNDIQFTNHRAFSTVYGLVRHTAGRTHKKSANNLILSSSLPSGI